MDRGDYPSFSNAGTVVSLMQCRWQVHLVLIMEKKKKIGEEAYELWRNNPQDMPKKVTIDDEKQGTNDGLKQGLTIGGILAILAFAL